ncbi:protein of unknown function, DUF4106 family [Trichomonas vaginalis G3]|uniref:protein of unknown function, DUF4106 family n=1 Tax=Trichomonas vaginalis (strain ATCC PRA-98 / G3) TaxID=412133 RepID=UPI0021E61CE2|nr:protein of unknown function, DUF4106 family [Trichomonas vaginalis G3]KAI5530076.1 protein of unknown function, DUF4106 family [Trichomonas vaginalis G3]
MPRKIRKNIRKRKRALKHPIVRLTPQQQLQQQMLNDPTMLQQMSSNPMLLNRVVGAQSGGLRAALLAKMAGYGGAADGTAYNPQSQMNLSSLKNQITDVKKSNIDIQKQICENEKKLEYDRHTKKLNELNVEKKKKEEQLKELSTEEYAKKMSEKAAEVAKMEQDVINLKNHTTRYKVLKDEEIKQKALKTYVDSDEYKKEVEANVKAEKLLQLQNQTIQYENLAQESKNDDASMQKVMKSAEYRDGTKEERFMSPDDLDRELVKNGLGTYVPADEVQETPQEEVQIQPDMEEIVQQQQLEAEGKLPKATPKKKRRVEQSESSEEVSTKH